MWLPGNIHQSDVVMWSVWALGLLVVVAMYKPWRGAPSVRAMRVVLERFWFLPDSVLKGVTRSANLGVAAALLYLLVGVAGIWQDAFPSSDPTWWRIQWVIWVLGTGVLIDFALIMSIIVFNRPRKFVPREFWDESGMLSEEWAEFVALVRRLRR